MKQYFSKKNRALLAELVRTDFKLRYQGSVLGYAWSLLRPLFMFVILYIIFGLVLKAGGGIPHFPVYLLLGVIIWNFFNEMTSQSLGSIVGRGDLIRKIRIPRWMIVFSSSISAVISLLLNLVIFAVFFVINGVEITPNILLLPLLLIEVYVFALGVSLFLAAAFVRYRDVTYIWEVALQAGIYITPIFYGMLFIQSELAHKIMLMNPMAQAIQDARFAVVSRDERVLTVTRVFDGGWYSLIPLLIVLGVLVGGALYFKKHSNTFAEDL